jgi:hypothetical protein
MSNLPLGKLLDADAKKDATHVAVAPVIVGDHSLSPGVHVAVVCGYANAAPRAACVGIIDPFLPRPASPGDRVWVFMYPKSITDLRHDWSHPAFPDEVPRVENSEVARLKEELREANSRAENLQQRLDDYDPCCP